MAHDEQLGVSQRSLSDAMRDTLTGSLSPG